MTNRTVQELAEQSYKYGWTTEVEEESAPPGLSEEIVRWISERKGEPEWLLEWRLKAYQHFMRLLGDAQLPAWANVSHPPIDFQSIRYYAAPKPKLELDNLDQVDAEILKTYEKLGIPLEEQKRLAGVAVDAIFDSVSIMTTAKETLAKYGVIFSSVSEAVKEHPELIRKYLGSVVPHSDNFYAALNSAVFSDGSFVYIPPGVRCPLELSTYFRINAEGSGQFERTLIIADKGSYVSYLEGCSAPMRDENQLHAAVVELVALDDAEIKYSTIQNWYPGDDNGKGGIFNFVTKRGKCAGDRSRISWTQVETGSAITWKYPSVLLQGDHSTGEFYSVALTKGAPAGGHRHEDDAPRQEHVQPHHLQGHLRRPRQQHVPGPRQGDAEGGERGQLHAVRLAPHRRPVRRAHRAVHRGAEPVGQRGARGIHHEGERGPALLLSAARARAGRRAVRHRQRLRSGRGQAAAARIRRRSGPAARSQPGGNGRLMLEVRGLCAAVAGVEILKGVDLSVGVDETHAIMGPNGSGKSTLAYVLAGRPGYEVTAGSVTFEGEDLLSLPAEERARRGLFLSFQHPIEIPGVRMDHFLRAGYNEMRKSAGEEQLDPLKFDRLIRAKAKAVEMEPAMIKRAVNEGFSGGEKKRNEVLQMAVLEPRVRILDEIDSGLDIDALREVARGITDLSVPGTSTILVTHYDRILSYLEPDHVHVLIDGRIARSGGRALAKEIEERGYDWLAAGTGV